MREYNVGNLSTDAGNHYNIPINMKEEAFYNLVYEFVDLAKVKGLTIRQAQHLFTTCADYVLESKLK